MSEPLLILPLTLIALLIGIYALTQRRFKSVPLSFADSREEALTRRVASQVSCSLEQAVTFVRTEIEIAPNQSDDVIAKRAIYHYRMNIPETTCSVYRDNVRG